MPTKKMFGKKFDTRPDRLDLRDLPYRAPLRSLPEQYPSQQLIDVGLPLYDRTNMVLDQGEEGACTGFGLAAVVNYLKWESWYVRQNAKRKAPAKVSTRMLYQNARLYDEWKGEDYEGSSCRGAIKGFHRHGVCGEKLWPYLKKPGRPKDGWRDEAAQTPLGAYYRIDAGNIVDMQAAIHEVHAIYASALAHDGWDQVENCKSLDDAIIPLPKKKDRGGHAFALVGYTPDGFILQNSWGPDWGYHGFAVLTYDDWVKSATDAWVLALGAPIRRVSSPITRTDISLKQRSEHEAPAAKTSQGTAERTRAAAGPAQWSSEDEAEHTVFIGQGGRADREAVMAIDAADSVRLVAERAAESGKAIVIYCHGGLNDREAGLARARTMGPWLQANDIHPIFVVWQTGFLESAKNILDATPRATTEAELAQARGRILERIREEMDRGFEVSARNFGVKAIWEDMKERAMRASGPDGGLKHLAKSLADAGVREVNLVGHSAGAILIGAFLGLMRDRLKPRTLHLWAPACTIEFANKTYGKAFGGLIKPANTYISQLSDKNETSDACIPLLYSKSLLYLVSRALEPSHKTPILGLEMIMPEFSKTWEEVFGGRHHDSLKQWHTIAKGVNIDRVIEHNVRSAIDGKNPVTIRADHGSFDNNIDVVNRAIGRILGAAKPPAPVTDLRGF